MNWVPSVSTPTHVGRALRSCAHASGEDRVTRHAASPNRSSTRIPPLALGCAVCWVVCLADDEEEADAVADGNEVRACWSSDGVKQRCCKPLVFCGSPWFTFRKCCLQSDQLENASPHSGH